MKKQLYKAALLAALGLAGTTAAQAGQFDMFIGFNDAAGPTAAQNDYVIDLGAASLFTTTYANTWTISQSSFDSAFVTPDAAHWASDVAVGVIGAASGYLQYQTGASGQTAGQEDFPAVNTLNNPNLNVGVNASTSPSGWTALVALDPNNYGNGTGNEDGSWSAYTGVNPMQFLSSGTASMVLSKETDSGGQTPTITGWTDIGTFSINANDGVDSISFNGFDATSVPEPGTYGLLAGAGLLLLSLRRQFRGQIV